MIAARTRVARGPVCAAVLVVAGLLAAGTAEATPPPNDDFAAATSLSGDSPAASGSTVEASAEPGEPNHAGHSSGKSVWFRWTAPRSGRIRVACESGFDAVVAVYRGASLSALTEVGSGRLGLGCSASLRFRAVAGTEYRVAVDAASGAGGEFTLSIEDESPVPGNDDFAAAKAFTDFGGNATALGTTEGAGREVGEPAHGGEAVGSSVWFRWSAQRTGTTRIYPCEGNFHPRVTVYSGSSLGALTPLGAAGDVGAGDLSCLLGGRGGASFAAVAGRSYAVAVDGFAGEWGWFSLSLVEAPIPDVFAPRTYINWQKRLGPRRFRFWFSAGEPGVSFACRLDRRPFRPCAPPVTYGGLSPGPHRFAVKAADALGNLARSPAIRHFRVTARVKHR